MNRRIMFISLSTFISGVGMSYGSNNNNDWGLRVYGMVPDRVITENVYMADYASMNKGSIRAMMGSMKILTKLFSEHLSLKDISDINRLKSIFLSKANEIMDCYRQRSDGFSVEQLRLRQDVVINYKIDQMTGEMKYALAKYFEKIDSLGLIGSPNVDVEIAVLRELGKALKLLPE